MISCGQENKELWELRIPYEIYRELKVRGRTGLRYLVLEDCFEIIGNNENRPEENHPAGSPQNDP